MIDNTGTTPSSRCAPRCRGGGAVVADSEGLICGVYQYNLAFYPDVPGCTLFFFVIPSPKLSDVMKNDGELRELQH